MGREIDAAFSDMAETAARTWKAYLAADAENAAVPDAEAKEAHRLSTVVPALAEGLAQQRMIAELYGVDEGLVRRSVEVATWRSWAESEREAGRWKRKYFRMRRLAARLVREIRKFSPEGAEITDRKLAAIAGIRRGGDEVENEELYLRAVEIAVRAEDRFLAAVEANRALGDRRALQERHRETEVHPAAREACAQQELVAELFGVTLGTVLEDVARALLERDARERRDKTRQGRERG